ncbi:TolC family protein [Flavobacterium sp. IB48]|uniref:TolC family protein n=1 Tax=Flavobacterium sp. IB48 TaxID=2779375 RepID=UPI0018E80910|nr:TolC family protein [Flavobacterium sp. IB48]MBJ2125132.1 TolC family protein [Flavobacterium sp. IB48]
MKIQLLKAKFYLILFSVALIGLEVNAQTASLEYCFNAAKQNNISLKQAKSGLKTVEYNLQAEKNSYFPKVDLLSSYTYLSSPLTINLQSVKDGIVEGSSKQSVNTANQIYNEITGGNLSQAAQDRIYNTSKTIIGGIYPNYNPSLSEQSYFLAGVGVRQPLYLGNKLNSSVDLAQSVVTSAGLNVEAVDKEVTFLITLQYLRILYLNSLMQKQQMIITALDKNKTYAEESVKNEILPPYQKNWTNVVLIQAKSQFNSIENDKKNAQIELNKLMGADLDQVLTISDTLNYNRINLSEPKKDFWLTNPVQQMAESKIAYAETAKKISKSLALPNVFAVGNFNLYQKDLPVAIPDWFVALELQWTLFNAQTSKRTQAAKQLIDEARLGEENVSLLLQVKSKAAKNKMDSLEKDVEALEAARKEARTTSSLITQRMNNQMSSPKDVNDALLVETEIEKVYYTAVFGYYVALAEYLNSIGEPTRITQFIK